MSVIPDKKPGAFGSSPDAALPESVFLPPEDVGGAQPRHPDDEFGRYLRPPMPCRDGRYASRLLRRAEGTVLIDYPVAGFHTTLLEHVTRYRGAGAAAYLRELRLAAGRDGGCTDDAGLWTVEETGIAGPRSLLIRLHEEFEDPSGQPASKDSYLIAARTGQMVVVLADLGWEMGSGRADTVRDLVDAALRRAGTLR
ncbi:hypothetical protein ACPCHT_06565 [Nucisporomicrobium flavum]|uniref:hypothetical protein n=1 Tax=Nucisporomicrobium flavum TaxID=2785915 RepID=UPI003C2F2E4F